MNGFLTDQQIEQALQAGELIRQGTWAADCIRHASYMLRLSREVHVIDSVNQSTTTARHVQIVTVDTNNPLVLSPGQTALLYSMEELKLPDDMLGFTVARGLLYVEALTPENTYVDPGFSGRLYTTVVNLSSRNVTLRVGMGIARLFLYRISQPVGEPYRSGSALGIEQQLDSVHAVPVTTRDQAYTTSDVDLREALYGTGPAGLMAAEFAARASRRMLGIVIFATLWPLTLQLSVHLGSSNPVVVFCLGIVGNLIAAMIGYFAPKFFKRWKP